MIAATGNPEKQIASTIRGVSSELAEDVDSLNANGGRGILISVSPHFTQQSEVFERLGRVFIATPHEMRNSPVKLNLKSPRIMPN
jgi:hypothetical protein